jgi:hypothetical protein
MLRRLDANEPIFGFVQHAVDCFEEHYGAKLTPELAAQWRQLILGGQCKSYASHHSPFRSIQLCLWPARNVLVPVVYDALSDKIITVLPVGCPRGVA